MSRSCLFPLLFLSFLSDMHIHTQAHTRTPSLFILYKLLYVTSRLYPAKHPVIYIYRLCPDHFIYTLHLAATKFFSHIFICTKTNSHTLNIYVLVSFLYCIPRFPHHTYSTIVISADHMHTLGPFILFTSLTWLPPVTFYIYVFLFVALYILFSVYFIL